MSFYLLHKMFQKQNAINGVKANHTSQKVEQQLINWLCLKLKSVSKSSLLSSACLFLLYIGQFESLLLKPCFLIPQSTCVTHHITTTCELHIMVQNYRAAWFCLVSSCTHCSVPTVMSRSEFSFLIVFSFHSCLFSVPGLLHSLYEFSPSPSVSACLISPLV